MLCQPETHLGAELHVLTRTQVALWLGGLPSPLACLLLLDSGNSRVCVSWSQSCDLVSIQSGHSEAPSAVHHADELTPATAQGHSEVPDV